MKSSGAYPALFCILTIGGAAGAFIIHQDQQHVTGYEKGSIVLPVSYQVTEETPWFQIRWEFLHHQGPVQLVICTIQNTPLRFGKKSFQLFPPDGYEGRMWMFPENGSLFIQRLAMKDSGTYVVSVMDFHQTKSASIDVTVIHPEAPGSMPVNDSSTDQEPIIEGHCFCYGNSSLLDVPTSIWIVLSSRVFSILIILLVLLSLHIRARKAHKRRMLSRTHKYH